MNDLTDPTNLTASGNMLVRQEQFEEAESAYWQAIAADEDFAPPYRNLALMYQLQGNANDAITMYQHYLERVPEDGEAHHNLGLLYMEQGMTD